MLVQDVEQFVGFSDSNPTPALVGGLLVAISVAMLFFRGKVTENFRQILELPPHSVPDGRAKAKFAFWAVALGCGLLGGMSLILWVA